MAREALRQALDDSVLTHTGRSIGDLASQRVVDDVWPLIEAREAQMREIVEAMAHLDLVYLDEHLEFSCPACQAFVSADWGSGRKPRGMMGREWAEHRMKHEPHCPVIKARAVLASEPAATTAK